MSEPACQCCTAPVVMPDVLTCGHCGSTRPAGAHRIHGRTILVCRDCAHYVSEPSTEAAVREYGCASWKIEREAVAS